MRMIGMEMNVPHHRENLSSSAKLTRFLTKVNLIPISANESYSEARFSVVSSRTFLYLLVTYLPYAVVGAIWIIFSDFSVEYFAKCKKFYVPFELLVFMLFLTIKFLSSPLFTICICKPFRDLREISMKSSLIGMTTRDIVEFNVGGLIIVSGYILQYISHYLAVAPLLENVSPTQSFLILIVCTSVLLVWSVSLISVPYIIVLIWLANIKQLFKTKDDELTSLEWAQTCIEVYQKMEDTLGVYFLYYFSLDQFFWICNIFLTLSLSIGDNSMSSSTIIMHSAGWMLIEEMKVLL